MKHDLPESFTEAERQCILLGVEITEEFYEKASIYLDLLVECSGRMNLTGPAERGRLWNRHVLESVAYAPLLEDQPVVDVGSGAGFPGLILALLGFGVVMIEPRQKKSAFLETAVRACGLSSEVKPQRIENAGLFSTGTQFTCRAVSDPLQMIRLVSNATRGKFSLFARVSTMVNIENGFVRYTELPVPPLDRKGTILQYSNFC